MRILPAGFYGPDPNRFRLRIQAAPVAPSSARPAPNPAADLARRLIELREHLDDLGHASGTRRTSSRSGRAGDAPALALSRNPLVITTAGSPTTLATGGLVSSPTTLVGLTQSFAGASTSQAVFDGTYDGSLGDQVELTFQVKREGILGQDDTEVEVFDEEGTRIDQLKIDKDEPGEVFTLSVGPQVSFTAGELVEDEVFTLHLSTLGGVLDPDQVFQGSGLPGSATYQTGFDQGSTALATVGGTYNGAFDDTLRFEVKKDGVVGQDDVEIEVFDGNGDKIGTLQFKKELAVGTELSLSNGLTLALSAGELFKPDEFEVSVKADDRVVFGDGLQVQAGTLQINGTAITVDALDTIRTLADKITASGADVTASFDAVTGEFLLTSNDDGPGAIGLGPGPDNTGFFAAIGLDENQQVPGTVEGTTGVTQLSELPGLTSGTFSIDGEDVSVDVATDTIDDVLARINALQGDVFASFTGNRLRLQSSEVFDLQNGTSAFFDAFEIDTGLYQTRKRNSSRRPEGVEDTSQLRRSLNGVQRSLGELFAPSSGSQRPGHALQLEQAIRDSFARDERSASTLNSGLGLRFQLVSTTDPLTIDSGRLGRALSKSSHELRDFLSGRPDENEDPGFVGHLSSAVDKLLEQVAKRLDPLRDGGLLIDLRA